MLKGCVRGRIPQNKKIDGVIVEEILDQERDFSRV